MKQRNRKEVRTKIRYGEKIYKGRVTGREQHRERDEERKERA